MGFNSGFKGLIYCWLSRCRSRRSWLEIITYEISDEN